MEAVAGEEEESGSFNKTSPSDDVLMMRGITNITIPARARVQYSTTNSIENQSRTSQF